MFVKFITMSLQIRYYVFKIRYYEFTKSLLRF